MNVAFVTTQLFDEPRSGGERCTARLLGELTRAGHRVSLIGRGAAPGLPCPGVSTQTLGPLVAPFATLPWPRRAAHLAAAWCRGRASTVQRLASDGAGAAVRRWLLAQRAAGLDLLVVDHLQAYPWVAPLLPGLPSPVVLMHNLESAGYLERAALASAAGHRVQAAVFRREARLLQGWENELLRHAAAVACLSEDDAEAWRRMVATGGHRTHVDVLPGFAPVDAGPERQASAAPGERRIGMLGTWTWGPNREALDWMLKQVLPRLPAHCVLHLAGAGLDGLGLPPQVRSLGRLADVATFYAAVDVVAVPSHTGSGVHEKVIEAIARAPALVATRHALRGLQAAALPHVCVVDEAEGFALACAAFDAPAAPQRDAAVRDWSARREADYRLALARCLRAAT